MRTKSPTRFLLPFAFAAMLLTVPAGSAGHGPLPTPDPTLDAVSTTQEHTASSANLFLDYLGYTQNQTLAGVQTVQDGLSGQQVIVPMDELDNITDQGFENGEALIRLAAASGHAIIDGSQDQEDEVEAFQALMGTTLTNALGIDPSNPHRVLTETSAPCVRNLQDALDDAQPGEEIRVCAGTYEGPIQVDEHFVSLVAEQGPSATLVDGQGEDGFIVTGSGVTISGFRITGADDPGSAGIRIGDGEEHAGVDGMFGTTILDNEFHHNSHGVVAHDAPGTTIALNTFWGSKVTPGQGGGIGVLVAGAPESVPDPVTEADEDPYGTLIVANNFQHNARHAIASFPGSPEHPSLPSVAAFNYHNSPLGPNVQLIDACHGPEAPEGDPYCRDGIGRGVLVIGFSPIPL